MTDTYETLTTLWYDGHMTDAQYLKRVSAIASYDGILKAINMVYEEERSELEAMAAIVAWEK